MDTRCVRSTHVLIASADDLYRKVAGTIHLTKGQTLSVSMYSSGDQSYNLQRESGFSCQMFGLCKGEWWFGFREV